MLRLKRDEFRGQGRVGGAGPPVTARTCRRRRQRPSADLPIQPPPTTPPRRHPTRRTTSHQPPPTNPAETGKPASTNISPTKHRSANRPTVAHPPVSFMAERPAGQQLGRLPNPTRLRAKAAKLPVLGLNPLGLEHRPRLRLRPLLRRRPGGMPVTGVAPPVAGPRAGRPPDTHPSGTQQRVSSGDPSSIVAWARSRTSGCRSCASNSAESFPALNQPLGLALGHRAEPASEPTPSASTMGSTVWPFSCAR